MPDGVTSGPSLKAWLRVDTILTALAVLALAVPTLVHLAKQEWSTEAGSAGPIILFSGIWLVWRQWGDFRKLSAPGNGFVVALVLLVSLACYIIGTMTDLLTLEAGGLFGVGLAILYAEFGGAPLLRHWFPLFYLAFLVPMPRTAVDKVTLPLKQLATTVSAETLSALGFPVAHSGVVINVAQYQLFVADACSGMNSIFGLIAVTLLYVYLRNNSSKGYVAFLACLAIPIAVVSNILRICLLVLLTYVGGDELAQGFLHGTAGIFTFVSALVLMIGIDWLITSVRRRRAA